MPPPAILTGGPRNQKFALPGRSKSDNLGDEKWNANMPDDLS
jgi:hypothetical protein